MIGVSLYTWTSIIGVVLAGISLGNYVGGVIADRLGSRRTPSLILGMVSPVVIKLTLTDLKRTGNVVGKFYAFSTLGSIVGTFATGFVLISSFGTRWVVFGVGAVLIAMALLFGDFFRPRKDNLAVGAFSALILAALLFQIRATNALSSGCYKETDYFCIKVEDERASDNRALKVLRLDHLDHSYNSVEDPTYLEYGYVQVYAEMVEYVAQRTPDYRAFFIGGGGYTLPRYMEARHPSATIEVAEIDPGVTETAFERMGLDPRTRIITYNADAREVVERKQGGEKYDLVFGDAFNDLQVPYHLTTREFDQKIRGMLKDDGIYLTNVVDKLDGGRFLPAYVVTVAAVFPHVYVLAEEGQLDTRSADADDLSTYVVAASATPIAFERLQAIQGQGPNGRSIVGVMPEDRMRAWLGGSPVVLLTDDHAPVDNLVAPLFVERGF